jgi:ADP-ribose pyrophosphatase YjhB (NUDIX family)
MAWIEDLDQNVLLVRQAAGLKLWTLPGGKVKRGESLLKALKREVYEETGLRVQIGSLLGLLDRHDKDASRCFLQQSRAHNHLRLDTNKRKLREPLSRPLYPRRLHHPPNTSGLLGEVLSKERGKFRPQRINSRSFSNRTTRPAVGAGSSAGDAWSVTPTSCESRISVGLHPDNRATCKNRTFLRFS